MLNPTNIHFDRDNQLIVQDSNNGRIQTLDANGSYRRSFRVFENFSSVVIDKKGLIFCSPTAGLQKPLIHIFNYAGKLVRSFGKRIKFKEDLYGLNGVNMSMNGKGELYVGWQFFPVVRKYSKDMTLLSEIKLKNPKMKQSEDFNYRSIGGPAEKRQYKIVMAGLKAKEDGGFYVFQFYPRIEILEFNDKGEQVNHYWADQPYNFIGNDFMVHEGPEGKRFYVLQVFPESRVDVFTIR